MKNSIKRLCKLLINRGRWALYIWFWIPITIHGQEKSTDPWLLEQRLPDWALSVYQKQWATRDYILCSDMNPFYLESDFNADRQSDIVLFVEHKGSRKKGLLILHGLKNEYFLLGAGKEFGNAGDDFNWIDIWKVHRVKSTANKANLPNTSNTAIWVEKSESASALIQWDGKKYIWKQAGD
ncbi:MAG: hypothetical protein IPM34_13795 [Saprospiraceae bacterium]|nr:hypothetical protein [Saprospiraceae bacterium]